MTTRLLLHAWKMRALNAWVDRGSGRWRPRLNYDSWLDHAREFCRERNRERALLGLERRRLKQLPVAAQGRTKCPATT